MRAAWFLCLNLVGRELHTQLITDTHDETQLFSFQHFNKMQSAVFVAAYRSDENLVVSGKVRCDLRT